ncbi:MAG: TonB-dependent receptor [Candidatus Azobacteroides sp.]|nr:TonB-dependent receptor [Candidatus Azobacteroides sp.]
MVERSGMFCPAVNRQFNGTDMLRMFLCAVLLCRGLMLCGQLSDSARIHKIDEISVTERKADKNMRSGMPVQSLEHETLKDMNVLQLSDAVKHFAGVVVKDFGGVGGMKTVSVRGMGAAHTAVGYDGILVSDVQSGTVDIGRFSLDNVKLITLNNGQSEDIFQPARLFSSASVLNIQHLDPEFVGNRPFSAGVILKTGSFDFWNPSLCLNYKLNDMISMSFSGEYLQTDGDYPFRSDFEGKDSLYYRQNSDVRSFRVEPAIYADFREKGKMYAKAYYFQSERGLPGAIIPYLYVSHQRLWDKNLFIQTQYKNDFSPRLSFQFNGKYFWSYQHYFNPDFPVAKIAEDGNTYYQQEYYCSAAALYKVFPGLSFSLSTDGFINQLNTDTVGFVCPTRYSWLTSLAGKYVTDRFTVTGSLSASAVNDEVKVGVAGDDYRKITPALSFSIKPFAEEKFRMRAFYKEIFRMPTFNDVYYTQVGNRNIKPESTTQYNLGLTWVKSFGGLFSDLNISVDGYYNRVKNKIVAYPVGDLFFWRILNRGLVDIKGMDVTVESKLVFNSRLAMDVSANYTYQKVLDKTDPNGKTYNNGLPYTPEHSGAASARIVFPWFVLGYNLLFSGERYSGDQNAKENLMPGYVDQSISVRKDFIFHDIHAFLQLEVLNVGNVRYSVVNAYPMQGRSFRVAVSGKF